MFLQTWRKYLPVIILLMKRSDKGQQILDMNYTDFQRASGGKKIKLTFSNVMLTNGRSDVETKYPALANDLILVLKENEHSGLLMKSKSFEFSMNSDFQLTIRNNAM
ncbi:MAG TPA: hypothetical protein VJ765_00500 [Chitinophagaceae bacterium]|nr:hypothetical protein [Chitinophagaceae bacterium]